MTHFDLIIVGSGSGNSLITEEMADWRIAVVEESTFGGTCLNVGCIPTKMFVYTADLAARTRDSARFGVDARVEAVDWPAIRDRIFTRIDPISAAGRRHREHSHHTTLYESHAEFAGPRTLRLADGQEITADRIVLATGARAVVPDMITAAGVDYHTSDTIMRIDERPDRLVILGGGYIAAEFAHIFAAFGTEVTIIARGRALLRHLDDEISQRFTRLARTKWDVRLDAQVASLVAQEDGLHLTLADGTIVTGDALLVATGRHPNGDRLNAAAGGVDLDEAGRIVVDQYQRTTAEGVWALGDASSPDQLKHVANQDARIVAHNLIHPDALHRSDHDHVPAAIFTDPQIASVGMTEAQARAAGLDYATSVQMFGSTAYGWAMEDTTSVCKLVAECQTGRLLGAHLMGPDASMLIQPLITAMSFGLRVAELARGQYWIHPALTEVVENALLALDLQPSAS